MTLTFSDPLTPETSWSAYLDWARRLRQLGGLRRLAVSEPDAPLYSPVFVAANDPQQGVVAFFAALAGVAGLRVDPMEQEIAAHLHRPGTPVEALVYLPEDTPVTATALYTPLHVGAVVALGPAGEGGAAHLPELTKTGGTAVGVIDDGLPWLHAATRTGTGGSRIAALWMQRLAAADGDAIETGRVLTRAEIEAELARIGHAPETQVYKALNRRVYPRLPSTSVERAASHGAHVLDLAAGAAPGTGDPVEDVPILAVQLPPEAIDDTSGMRMDTWLVAGLRWMIASAHAMGLTRLVVNASLGVVAGPKDGSRFVEQQMAVEIDRAAAAGLTVEVVLPMGNDHDTRLVAEAHITGGGHFDIGFDLPRDDRTPSYIEIRAQRSVGDAGLAGLRLGLVPPDGDGTGHVDVPPPGQARPLIHDGVEVGRLYHMAERTFADRDPDRAHLVLAFAPSAPAVFEGRTGAPVLVRGGPWRLYLESQAAQKLALMIQRDDTPFGYVQDGRQATFDESSAHERAAGIGARIGDYLSLGLDCPIRHEGTINAFATRNHPQIHVVAAAVAIGGTGDPCPASYSARGADWCGRTGPSDAVVVETSAVLTGTRAAGTVTGSAVRLSGTSTAAAMFTRGRILELLGQAMAGSDDATRPVRFAGRLPTRVATRG